MALNRSPYRGGRGLFGGGGSAYFPPVIKALLISNIGIFLFQMFFGSLMIGGNDLENWIVRYGALFPVGSYFFELWQPFTYMFLHAGFSHVLFNMFALWMFGIQLEHQWGSKKFLIYYIVCGLGGAAAHMIISPLMGGGANIPLVGASGAIFGVLAAFGLMFPDQMIYFYFLFPVKAKYFVVGYMALEVISEFGGGTPDNVGHLAHLGGAVVGILYIIIDMGLPQLMGKLRSQPRNDPWGDQGSSNNRWSQSSSNGNNIRNDGGGFFHRTKQQDDEPIDAEYYDINEEPQRGTATRGSDTRNDVRRGRVISQEEIDRILDKIADSGYQNLTEEERQILLEASRRMDEKR